MALLAIAVSLLSGVISSLAPDLPTWVTVSVLAVAVVLALWTLLAFFFSAAPASEGHTVADGQQYASPSRTSEEHPVAIGQQVRGPTSIWVSLAVGAALGAAIVTIVVSIVGVGQRSAGSITFSIENPPEGGTYSSPGTISGRVTNLSPGEMVWTFNQKYDKTGRLELPIFANPGPCPVTNETWRCENVYIGDSTKDNRRQFAVWASVVSEEQAKHIVADALVNTYKGGSGLPEGDVPHVTDVAPVKRTVTISNPGP